MWEGLDGVDWAGLRHNYGDAADVPGLLRLCGGRGPAGGHDAVEELHNLLFHQGGWICSAATAALPFLVRLAADPGVRCRAAVLDLVSVLAAEAGQVDGRYVDAGWPAAWEPALPRVLALLADAEPVIRRGAADAVAYCTSPGDLLLPALLRRWRAEDDPPTRLDLVLALGRARTREPAGDRHGEATALLRALLGSPEPQLRLAAVHALAVGDPGVAAGREELLLDAVREPGVALWRDTSMESGVQGVQGWTAGLFARAAPGSAPSPAFVLGLLADHPDPEQRAGAVAAAGGLLAEWRSPAAALLPAVAARLDDPEAEVRYRAAELLACLGPAAAACADAVAGLLDDGAASGVRTGETVGAAALWALARMNDPRCLPGLAARVADGNRSGFPAYSAYHGGPRFHFPALPSLDEVLARLPGHADRLLPAVRDGLATADTDTVARLCAVLTAWGPAARPAVPRLLDLLRDDATWPAAAEALAAVGPAGAEARTLLAARAAAATGAHAELAAWAYWRVGGGPGPALAALGPAAGRPHPRRALARLAGLGPHAAPCADRLRPLLGATDPWTAVEAAHALWAATGDTGSTVPVLLGAVRDLPAGTYLPVMLPAVRYLTRIGRPARAAAALLRDVPARDARIHCFAGWRAFTEDEAIRTAVARLLAATA